jgi:hypothetical protein
VAAATPEATGWRRGGEVLNWRHDVLHLQATGLVPSYFASATEATIARQVTRYTPMGQANHPSTMGSGGYARHIGLLPEWDVVYLTSNADPRARQALLVNAFAHGRWSMHFRDERTAQPVAPSHYPTRVIRGGGSASGVSANGPSTVNDYTPAGSGSVVGVWADSHHCSAGFMAYLLSGWHYFIEEAQMLASTCFYKLGDGTRQGRKGILRTDTHTTARGVAWCHRSVAQAAALSPQGDPLQADYLAIVEANVDYNHAIYVAQPNNPFGLMAPYGDGYTPAAKGITLADSTATAVRLDFRASDNEGKYEGWFLSIGGESRKVVRYVGATSTATVEAAFSVPTAGQPYEVSDRQNQVPIWMEDFLTGSFGYQLALDLPLSAAARAKLEAFFQWKARSVLGRFGTPGRSDEFHYCDAAQYVMAAAPTDNPDFIGGRGPFYASWGEIYRATLGKENIATSTDRLRGAYFPDATSYWGNLQPALAYAVTHGVPGAASAHARMSADPGWADFVATGNREPVWTLRPLR